MSKRGRVRADHVSCIFVHAGAGYHSIQNEAIHLQACHDASKAAMALLRAGGSAIDAIEIAIKVLEDREITNAGYGSNLTMDGVVECDAIIIDHHGRSGGAGAVAQIKNPISLARLLLNHSAAALSLRRVPPNFLVGQGATDFAWEHGLPVLPHDMLISPGAKERWKKWKSDLRAANHKAMLTQCARNGLSPEPSEPDMDYNEVQAEQESARSAHAKAMQQALFNEAQPATPAAVDQRVMSPPPTTIRPAPRSPTSDGYIDPRGASSSPSAKIEGTNAAFDNEIEKMGSVSRSGILDNLTISKDTVESSSIDDTPPFETTNYCVRPTELLHERTMYTQQTPIRTSVADLDDKITDTVGAIAIDSYGNMACGASSGGIGMKHRGRVGPAALVGVGASLIPADPADPQRTVVATVTSGTGEHMATTQAASTCSARILASQRRSKQGDLEDVSEDEALHAFIETDFMAHPSVKHSTSTGAIGAMSVKMSQEGAWIYFAHNTDSFALASMSSFDDQPSTTMSRSKGNGSIAQGGKPIRFSPRKSR